MQLNIDQMKQDACRMLAVIDLIERSSEKAKRIACSEFYDVFDLRMDQVLAIQQQNQVTQRLYKYLEKLTKQ